MSSSPVAPRGLPTNADHPPQPAVYNLTVLIRHVADGKLVARTANLHMPEIESDTVREALSAAVKAAKALIHSKSLESQDIPWIAPPHTPQESESRFVVPLHL